MKVLVTGASGFIGSSLCDALLSRGDTVVGLSRDPIKARATNPTVLWHPWQPTLERPPADAFDGVDAVVNLASRSLGWRGRVLGVAAAASSVGHLVLAKQLAAEVDTPD